ncbi:MAG: hypothetical protein M1400_02680 [Patescibacteria group bacterium]|nr:hypothetical protein [Patescibacteria group bacterium]
MNIRDFSEMHGLKAIVRRHAVYEKPALPVVGDNNAMNSLMCALIYSRTIDPKLLGLNKTGREMMYRQGELLVKMGILPELIISGVDQRNQDGARESAAAIRALTNRRTAFRAMQKVTYPKYDATRAYEAWQQFGDMAAHMYLAGRPEVKGLWNESAEAFEARITSAVTADYSEGAPVLFDLNFEQLTLLHFLHVEKIGLTDIPYGPDAWCPKNGGGIAYGTDGMVMEFDPEFQMIIKIVD